RGQPWPGVIAAYRDRLPVSAATPVVTLLEGATPLVDAPRLSERTGARVLLKLEGLNPTGSFKDRGMTLAMSKAVEDGAKAVICALGGAPDAHCIPVGNALNIGAYWKGYLEYEEHGRLRRRPRMLGWQAQGSAPLVHGEPVPYPETIATAIRIGNPANWGAAI